MAALSVSTRAARLFVLLAILLDNNTVTMAQNPRFPWESPARIDQFAIAGWYSGCGTTPVADSFDCSTRNFESLENHPLHFDTTGQTCYVNPLEENVAAVYWLGPSNIQNFLGPYFSLYTMHLNETAVDEYFPDDCIDGACSCDKLEPLREEWSEVLGGHWSKMVTGNSTLYSSTIFGVGEGPLVMREFNSQMKLGPDSCFVLGGGTSAELCYFPIDLVDTASSEEQSSLAPSAAPSDAPTSQEPTDSTPSAPATNSLRPSNASLPTGAPTESPTSRAHTRSLLSVPVIIFAILYTCGSS